MRPLAIILLVISALSCGSGSDGCCKVCKTGKACGDSCIASNDTCHQSAGCACNGEEAR